MWLPGRRVKIINCPDSWFPDCLFLWPLLPSVPFQAAPFSPDMMLTGSGLTRLADEGGCHFSVSCSISLQFHYTQPFPRKPPWLQKRFCTTCRNVSDLERLSDGTRPVNWLWHLYFPWVKTGFLVSYMLSNAPSFEQQLSLISVMVVESNCKGKFPGASHWNETPVSAARLCYWSLRHWSWDALDLAEHYLFWRPETYPVSVLQMSMWEPGSAL